MIIRITFLEEAEHTLLSTVSREGTSREASGVVAWKEKESPN